MTSIESHPNAWMHPKYGRSQKPKASEEGHHEKPEVPTDEEPSPKQRKFMYGNWHGRDALAMTLGFWPSEDDMRGYQAHCSDRWRASTALEDQLYRKTREKRFLMFCPSVDPQDQSPEFNWPMQQSSNMDTTRLRIVSGTARYKVASSGHLMLDWMSESCGKPDAVVYPTGDDHKAPMLLEGVVGSIAQLSAALSFPRRMEPDPEDVPKGSLDALPLEFFPPDAHLEVVSKEVIQLHKDFCAEAGTDHVSVTFMQATEGSNDYRLWMARVLKAVDLGWDGAEAEAQTLLRCIGMTEDVSVARCLMGQLFYTFSEALPEDERFKHETLTLMQSMYGSTFFPSVFFNLADLEPETLALDTYAKYPSLMWCF